MVVGPALTCLENVFTITILHINYGVGGVIDIHAGEGEARSRDLWLGSQGEGVLPRTRLGSRERGGGHDPGWGVTGASRLN